MVPLGNYWIEHCDAKSKREGWALFNTDDGIEIMALDEPEPGQEQLKDDDEAIELIIKKALNGSKLHVLALYLDGKTSERDNILVPCILIEE